MEDFTKAIEAGENLDGAVQAFFDSTDEEKVRFLETLQRVKSESAGQFLGTVYSREQSKTIRKLIKKSLFRLKTSGIMVPDLDEGGESALRKFEEIRKHQGFMSSYDPEGTRIVILGVEVKRNSVAFFHGILHYSNGLLEMMSAPVMRKDFQALIADFRDTAPESIVFREIPAAYALYLLDEGSRVSGKYIEELKQVRQSAATLKGTVEKPADIYALHVPDDVDAAPVEGILEKDIFLTLPISWESLEKDQELFESQTNSTLLIPPYIMEEKKSRFIKGILEQEPFEKQIPGIRRLLEDYCYLLYLTEDYEAFKGLAAGLSDTGSFEGILHLLVRRALEKKKEEPAAGPGILINPYEQIRR